jgi:hypothetical protein
MEELNNISKIKNLVGNILLKACTLEDGLKQIDEILNQEKLSWLKRIAPESDKYGDDGWTAYYDELFANAEKDLKGEK